MSLGSRPDSQKSLGFPKSVRILRRSDFRKVYDEGFRHTCPFFAAFCLRISAEPEGESSDEKAGGPHIGFTTPRALGKAVVRNRIRRRLRESVRLNLESLPRTWWIVLNPRKPVLEAPFADLEREVRRLFERCAKS
ncbi:MAG: ribonuclease P protein component [Bryobacteraceae bacterium]|nr:ribonuclease P protein component [Bryobacteraceae bacterium]